jgi:hypothetical protein
MPKATQKFPRAMRKRTENSKSKLHQNFQCIDNHIPASRPLLLLLCSHHLLRNQLPLHLARGRLGNLLRKPDLGRDLERRELLAGPLLELLLLEFFPISQFDSAPDVLAVSFGVDSESDTLGDRRMLGDCVVQLDGGDLLAAFVYEFFETTWT